ncbi:MAG: 23S rRNA (guanosine(2251)-2'-O)-methyltransferase RlmB, partial [Acidiferrobacterales bacterium]
EYSPALDRLTLADRRAYEIVQTARAGHVKLQWVPRARLDELAGTARHQGIVARTCTASRLDEHDLEGFIAQLAETPLLLILDGVQDPHNLGACIRCADGAGAHAVIVPRDRAVSVTATVRRAACGAAESVPLFQVTNLSRVLRQLKRAGIWLLGASQAAGSEFFETDLTGPLAVVLGGEEKGLRRLTRQHCDALVSIPMRGIVPSLNVSVAAAVFLYEAVRQRGARAGRDVRRQG